MKNRIMNHRRRRLASLVTFILIGSFTLMPTALMQTNRQTPPVRPSPSPVRPIPGGQRRDTPPARRQEVVKIDPSVVRVVTRAPLAFKPLEMVDPRTGKAVTPDTMLTLDNGRQITAAKFYQQMNQLEAGLNKTGYSFRDQQKEVVTNEVVVDKERTLAQIRNMRFVTPNPRTARQLDAIAQAHRDYVRTVNPDFGKPAPRRVSAKVNNGLYQQKVGVLIPKLGTYTVVEPASPIKYTVLERPDFAPGDNDIDTSKETESLPGTSSDPGWATGGKLASAIQINASWKKIAFYVNYLNAATAPLAQRYLWQIAKPGPNLDNFGSFGKSWATEFDDQELVNWQNPPGLLWGGNVNFYSPTGDVKNPKRHLLLLDFGKLVGPPPETSANYLVRVIPVDAHDNIAGYPSRPVLVTYGTHPEFKPIVIKLKTTQGAKIPVNNVTQEVPSSFGNPKVASIDLNTWMNSNGSSGYESASLGFKVGCSVYGNPVPLLEVSASGELSPGKVNEDGDVTVSGKAKAEVHVLLVGQELPCDTCKQEGPTELDLNYVEMEPFGKSFTVGFPIGPIDVSATIGIKGVVGVGGHVTLKPIGKANGSPFSISAGPFLGVGASLEAGVGIGLGGYDVVEVGVGGHVNLISAAVVLGFSIQNDNNSNVPSSGYYFGRISEFKALNGSFDGVATAGICPLCKTWTHKLYSWDGYDMLATDPGRATLFEGKL